MQLLWSVFMWSWVWWTVPRECVKWVIPTAGSWPSPAPPSWGHVCTKIDKYTQTDKHINCRQTDRQTDRQGWHTYLLSRSHNPLALTTNGSSFTWPVPLFVIFPALLTPLIFCCFFFTTQQENKKTSPLIHVTYIQIQVLCTYTYGTHYNNAKQWVSSFALKGPIGQSLALGWRYNPWAAPSGYNTILRLAIARRASTSARFRVRVVYWLRPHLHRAAILLRTCSSFAFLEEHSNVVSSRLSY